MIETQRRDKERRLNKKKKTPRDGYCETHSHRQTHSFSFLGVWYAAEGCLREAPGSTSALETITMLFPASRSLAVPLSARGPTLHFSNAQTTQFWHLYSVQSSSRSQPGFGNEHPQLDKHLQFGWLLRCQLLFALSFMLLLLFFISHFSPFSSLSLPHFLHQANLFWPPPPPPLILPVFLPFHPQSLCVLRTFEVALTGMKRVQTHFGLCLFAVYINESFMCWVYGGTR